MILPASGEAASKPSARERASAPRFMDPPRKYIQRVISPGSFRAGKEDFQPRSRKSTIRAEAAFKAAAQASVQIDAEIG